MAKKPPIPEEVLEFFRRTGAEGGKERARRHTPEELSAWAKKGGRPRKAGPKLKGGK